MTTELTPSPRGGRGGQPTRPQGCLQPARWASGLHRYEQFDDGVRVLRAQEAFVHVFKLYAFQDLESGGRQPVCVGR